jgi:hypothetical protein
MQSAGPTYNGHHDRFDLMISFYDGDAIPEAIKQDLMAFAQRPAAIGSHRPDEPSPQPHDGLPPAGFMALPHRDGVLFHWEAAAGTNAHYRIRHCAAGNARERVIDVTGRTWFVDRSEFIDTVDTDGWITATIETVGADGIQPLRSPEIRFCLTAASDAAVEIPIDFTARVLWANFTAWIQRVLI